MFTLIARNQYGQQLELTHNDAYSIKSIDGLDPPEAVINTTHNAGLDGSVYNSAYMSDRVITITLAIEGPAEENRINLYKYFKSKFPVRIYYKNETRNVYIDGYTRVVAISFFDIKQVAQITIFCPQPNFNEVMADVQDMSNIENLFEFPFSIEAAGIPFSEIIANMEKSIRNDGDLETGVQISIMATGTVVNPKVFNMKTGDSMILDMTLAAGDMIRIDTRTGSKAVTLTSDGVTTSVVGKLRYGSDWFSLQPGDNIFTIAADSGAEYMKAVFTVIGQFEGV